MFVSLLLTQKGQERLYATAPQLKHDMDFGQLERRGQGLPEKKSTSVKMVRSG